MGTAFVAVVFDAISNPIIRRIVPQGRFGFGEAYPRASSLRAFTFIEVMVSLALLTLLTVCATWAFGQMNSSAAVSRVNSCAQMVAQNYADAFLSAEPFNPQLSNSNVTPALVPQLPQFSTSPPCSMPPSTSSVGSPQICGPATVTIYSDPGGTLTVTGSVTLTAANLGLTQTTNGVTQNLNAYRLQVTLNYTFKGKAYSVALNTVRVSDF